MITNLQLKNFTAFTELAIDFSPGINIIIGENGTGKTQLLKAIFALSGSEAREELASEQLARKLCRLYLPLSGKVGALRCSGSRGEAMLSASFAWGEEITVRFRGSDTKTKVHVSGKSSAVPAIFIPTKEVLSLARGLSSREADFKTIDLIFDDSYIDLARLLFERVEGNLTKKIQEDPRLSSIIPRITNLIGGKYTLKAGNICFQAGQYKETSEPAIEDAETAGQVFKSSRVKFIAADSTQLSISMTAEGFRKIGMLQRLLSNGSLTPGSTGPLLWDEPESNLNPKLIKDLVLAFLELARNGQQVILATHDYVLLKWFDLLMDKGKGDQVVFHRLYREEGGGNIQRESQPSYSIVSRSAVSNAFAELYDEDVKRALGGG